MGRAKERASKMPGEERSGNFAALEGRPEERALKRPGKERSIDVRASDRQTGRSEIEGPPPIPLRSSAWFGLDWGRKYMVRIRDRHIRTLFSRLLGGIQRSLP